MSAHETRPIDWNAPAKMGAFSPVNPFALERDTIYLYHHENDDFTETADYFEQYGAIPLGDYIVQFKRYRPTTFLQYDFPVTWKQSSRVRMPVEPDESKVTKTRGMYAQCRILYYRGPDWDGNTSPWMLVDELDGAFGAIHVNPNGGRMNTPLKPGAASGPTNTIDYYLEIDCIARSPNRIFDLGAFSSLISKEPAGHPDLVQRSLKEVEPGRGTAVKMATLSRQISANISDQMDEATCWAYTVSRILLKLIRQIIPEMFGGLISSEHYCNSVYLSHMMRNLSYHVAICDEECFERGVGDGVAANNFLMFAFIYKILINKYGCGPLWSWKAMKWFVNYNINTPDSRLMDVAYIAKTFKAPKTPNGQECEHPAFFVEERDVLRIAGIMRTFFDRLYRIEGETAISDSIRAYQFTIPPTGLSREMAAVVKYVLGNGYYLGLSGKENETRCSHIITVVNYEEGEDGVLYITAKNSYGRTSLYHGGVQVAHNRGNLRFAFTPEIASLYKHMYFVLPSSLIEDDSRRLPGLNYCETTSDCQQQYGDDWKCAQNKCIKVFPRFLDTMSSTRRRTSRPHRSVPTPSKRLTSLTRRRRPNSV